MLDRVISACCARDLAVAKLTASHVIDHITAHRYIFAVPKADIARFQSAMPSEFEIVDENEFLGEHTIASIREMLPPQISERAGWYLQQFVKMGACNEDDRVTLIWDADTVPLRSLAFGEDKACISAYAGKEYHEPYFATLEKLTGLTKKTEESFIAQCLCVRGAWMASLLNEIEARSDRPWIDAILMSLVGKSAAEFSEYETIGNYVRHKFPGQIQFNKRRWSRFGYSLVGSIDNMSPRRVSQLAKAYDFIAFEEWDQNSKWYKPLKERVRYARHFIHSKLIGT